MLKLIFDSPAKTWEEGIPIGNGKQGAMIYGSPEKTILQCNEDTLWNGGPRNRNNTSAKEALPTIQQLIFDGKIQEAERLMQETMTAIPEHQRHFEPAGDIFLLNQQINEITEITDYSRELNLNQSLIHENYKLGNNAYDIEAFASYPKNIIAYAIRCSDSSDSRYRIHINRSRGLYSTNIITQDYIGIEGTSSDHGVSYCQLLSIKTDGNKIQRGQFLIVENFTYLEIYTTIATDFREKDPVQYCVNQLKDSMKQDWNTLKKQHEKDYQKLYNQMEFQLKGAQEEKVADLLADLNDESINPYLFELMFQYGRYLLISSSRPGSLPANLQGVWNNKLMPPWDSKYTININTEMNYWIAEKAGLSECHLPLFDHLERMYPNGQRTAKEMYGIDGFVAHHNTDLWGDTAPQDIYMPASYWPMGGAWLCLHIWEHYKFTKNQEFLDHYFYLLEDALRFLLNYMVELPNGEFVTNPSVSPENKYYTANGQVGYMSFGCTMDNQIIWELIEDYLEGIKHTKHDVKLVQLAQEVLQNLPPHKIGKHGQLMEWYEDYEEVAPGHRHVSHLFGLFPGHRLKTEKDEIFSAARNSLERRLANGGGYTGWSVAWLLNLWANFHNGEECYQMMYKQLKNSTLPNLLDNHPPFQIDGNFGFTSGVIEMFVQYYQGKLDILPALCKEWPKGMVKGIRLPNNSKVDIEWQEGKLKKLVIIGDLPKDTLVSINNNEEGLLRDVIELDKRINWNLKNKERNH